MLFGKLLPREGNFFELFNQHGNHIAEGARAFIRLIQHYADPELYAQFTGLDAATPPQAPWPRTTISATLSCVTANSSAAETP